jgi:hypothetical protein
MSPILKMEPDECDDERELDFELDYLATLTVQQRFEMMFRRSRELKELLEQHEPRRPPEVVKRT